jgi:dCTP diphosphatase
MTDDAQTTITALSDILFNFSKERSWDKGYDPSFLSKSIIIEAAELLEHFQKSDSKEAYLKMRDPSMRQAVAWEMADVVYYLLMLARILDIDISTSVHEKLANLASRYPA